MLYLTTGWQRPTTREVFGENMGSTFDVEDGYVDPNKNTRRRDFDAFEVDLGARDSDFAVSTPIEPMTNFQAAQKIQAKVRGKAARAPDAMAKRALKIRSEELLRLLQLQNKEGKEFVMGQCKHVIELCDAKVEGSTRESKMQAAEKAESLLAVYEGSGRYDLRAMGQLVLRSLIDLTELAKMLADLERIQSGQATAGDLEQIFTLMVLLDSKATQASIAIQAKIRGRAMRKEIELTGCPREAHRKLQQKEMHKLMVQEYQRNRRRLLRENSRIYNHPIFTQHIYIAGEDFEMEELFLFKKIFANADMDYLGYLGRRQFTDLLDILKIETDDDLKKEMFDKMDTDGSGTIEFEEFFTTTRAMLTPEQLSMCGEVKLGAHGTRAWSRGMIVWGANNGLIVITTGLVIAILVYFEFVLVPLTCAYFLTFLVSPLMNAMEYRPLVLGSDKARGKQCVLCMNTEPDPEFRGERRYKSEFRRSLISNPGRKTGGHYVEGAWKGGFYDFFCYCKFPHGLAVLTTLVVCFALLGLLVLVIAYEVTALLNDDVFIANLQAYVDDLYSSLNASGFKILRPSRQEHNGATAYTIEEVNRMFKLFIDAVNWVALVLLLTVYLMYEKTTKNMFDGSHEMMIEIESSIKTYISLKTAISFLTGAIVAVILALLQVKLAVLFGLLSFVLNFIPNVGSMMAMIAPMPLVIVDANLATWQKIVAFVGPGIVQGYVGNALEPVRSQPRQPASIHASALIHPPLPTCGHTH